MDGISVIIPCYNAAAFLRETIESVLSQDYPGPLEIVVADDDSTDGSRQVAESFGASVRVVSKPAEAKRGTPVALNRGILASTQPLVAILAADDVFLPGHLTALGTVLTVRPELGFVYDNAYYASSDGAIIGPLIPGRNESCLTPDDLLPAQFFGACSVVLRRAVFDRVGLFDETLGHAEDYDMWLRVVEAFPAAYVPIFGFKYRMHENQKSRKSTLWVVSARVFSNARKRYPYCWRSIRKRKAVLAYRFSQIALQEGRHLHAAYLLAKAGILDPYRALVEVRARLRQRVSRAVSPKVQV